MGSESNNGVCLGELSPSKRKMIQNLKEVVTKCTDSEIYAVLKECNMDPNDAVNRLISLGSSFFFLTLSSSLKKKKYFFCYFLFG